MKLQGFHKKKTEGSQSRQSTWRCSTRGKVATGAPQKDKRSIEKTEYLEGFHKGKNSHRGKRKSSYRGSQNGSSYKGSLICHSSFRGFTKGKVTTGVHKNRLNGYNGSLQYSWESTEVKGTIII